ncbi:hypothetical protein PCE1_003850 [Barthelona sp. PCE]
MDPCTPKPPSFVFNSQENFEMKSTSPRKQYREPPTINSKNTERHTGFASRKKRLSKTPNTLVSYGVGLDKRFFNPPPGETSTYFERAFDLIEELGSGEFGTAYHVRSKPQEYEESGQDYCIKVSRNPYRNDAERRRYVDEAKLRAAFGNHDCLMRQFSAWEEDSHIFMQMELGTSTLDRFIMDYFKGGPPTEEFLWDLLTCLFAGLEYLHSQDIGHFDIKPDNLFLVDEFFKIGDFGLARDANNFDDIMDGDKLYLAPEFFDDDLEKGPQADIYSVGLIMFEYGLFVNLPSGGSLYNELRQDKTDRFEGTDNEVSENYRLLCNMCMERNPKERVTAAWVCENVPAIAMRMESYDLNQFMASQQITINASVADSNDFMDVSPEVRKARQTLNFGGPLSPSPMRSTFNTQESEFAGFEDSYEETDEYAHKTSPFSNNTWRRRINRNFYDDDEL